MKTRIFLILSVIVLAFFPVNGQKIAFKNYTIKEGLPQSTVICIIQDSKGYIWMGTQAGLVRFDGKNFKTYTTAQGLTDNQVNCIYEDHKHRLWIGTENGGVSVFNGFNFKNYTRKDSLASNIVKEIIEDNSDNICLRTPEGISFIKSGKVKTFTRKNNLAHNNVLCFFQDKSGKIWCGTQEGITVFQDGKWLANYKSEVEYWDNDLKKNASVIFSILEDHKGLVWFASQGGGVSSFDGKVWKNYTIQEGIAITKNPQSKNTVISIFEDSRHNIWFGSYGMGVSFYDGKSIKAIYPQENKEDIYFMKFVEDSLGNVWCKTNSKGVYKIKNGQLIHYTQENSLAQDILWDIFVDREGNVWLATDGGVSVYGKGIFEIYNTSNGLPDNNIQSVLIDNRGAIYTSTNKNLIRLYNGKFKNIKIPWEHSPKDIISQYKDKKGSLWAGTYGTVFKSQNGQDYVFQNYKNYWKREDVDVNTAINDFCEDDEGNLWLGTENGLFRIRGATFTKFLKGASKDSGLVSNNIQALLIDNDHQLWIATLEGLSCYSKNSFTNYTVQNGLPNLLCTALALDKLGNVWVGTDGGLCRFSKNNDGKYSITTFTVKDGLESNNIMSIVADNEGNIWIGHLKGLNKINVASGKINYYGSIDGFAAIPETNQKAAAKDLDGNLWFGTKAGGLVKYIPENDRKNTLPPKTYITSVRIQGHDEPIERYAERIDSSTHLPIKLKLPPNRKSLTFEWIGLSYTIPEKVRYQYKLEGIDEQWSGLTDVTRTDEYKNLTNGKYTFLVKAYNNDGIGNPEPVSFSFEIKPPFWKTIWFILLEIATAVFLVIQVIRYRERQLQHDKKILEQKVEERTAEIQKQKKVIEDKNDELVAQQHEILAQRDEIQRQRDIAEGQRDQISFQKKEITDSIHYAKRIQNAILTPEEDSKRILGEHFILFKPRDIVSGDFYWMTKRDNKVVVTAADCTGHGVPGAFMSMLGVSFLNEIVNKEGIFHANEILNKLRDYVKTTLSQTGKEHEAKDGMDIALCVIDFNTNQVEFAGANNPLYIVRNNELIEFKGDNMPIGIHAGEERLFKNNVFEMQKKDMLYLFSDGYSDQFGGPDGGKFKTKPFKRLFVEINDRPLFQQWILLEETIEKWQGELDQVDDILVIGIRI